MKILCCCEHGNKRSVFTRNVLKHFGHHDVIACGVVGNTPDTVAMLSRWAEKILLAEPEMSAYIPLKYAKKIDFRFTIGPDTWPLYIYGPLKDLVYSKLKTLGYI